MSERELDEVIAELRIQLAALHARMDALEAGPAKTPDFEAINQRYAEEDFGEGR